METIRRDAPIANPSPPVGSRVCRGNPLVWWIVDELDEAAGRAWGVAPITPEPDGSPRHVRDELPLAGLRVLEGPAS